MNVFLIIIGALLFLFCGIFAASTRLIVKDQKTWDEFYAQLEKKSPAVPEEVVYKLVMKINFWASFGMIIGIVCLTGGILLAALK